MARSASRIATLMAGKAPSRLLRQRRPVGEGGDAQLMVRKEQKIRGIRYPITLVRP